MLHTFHLLVSLVPFPGDEYDIFFFRHHACCLDRLLAVGNHERLTRFARHDSALHIFDDLHRLSGTGADRIEIYTGPFAEAFEAGDAGAALTACADTARRAQAAGLGVNAGHDLSQANLAAFLAGVPGVQEVSIGHALIDESLYAGLDATVRAYLRILAN